MKIILIALFIVFFNTSFSQDIYRGLKYGMSKSEANNEYKTHNDLYDNIDLGHGFVWRTYSKNFIFINGGLVAVNLVPKGAAFGLGYDRTTSYLEFTAAFFEAKGYKEFFRPDYWQYPLNFKARYGLLLAAPDSSIMVQMYPIIVNLGNSKTSSPIVKVMNYRWFINSYNTDHAILDEKSKNSGF